MQVKYSFERENGDLVHCEWGLTSLNGSASALFLRPCFARFRMSRYDFLRCRHSRRVFKPFRIPAVEAAHGVHAPAREAPFEAAAHMAVIVFIAFLSAVSGLLRWKPPFAQ